MGNLKINGSTEFMGMELPIIEGGFGEDKRAMLVRDIAQLHERQMKHINENISSNRKRFKDGVDIIDLKSVGDTNRNLLRQCGFSNSSISNSSNIYLLSESGYAILLNIIDEFNEDTIKAIYRNYFVTDYYSFISVMKRDEGAFFQLIIPTIEKLGLTLCREYSCGGYRIDGYIPELKLAIEYDENNHNHYNQKEEKERQDMLESELGCDFIRVSDELELGEAIGVVLVKVMGRI